LLFLPQALRCLKLYLERLGFTFQPDGSSSSNQAAISDMIDLVSRAAMDAEFLNYRPTITAAAALYCERLQKGLLPFWPSSLASLTGYSDVRTPELAAAINGAQRLIKTLALSKREGDSAAAAAAAGAPAAAAAEAVAVAASPASAATAAAGAATDGGEACVPLADPVAVPAAAADAAAGPACSAADAEVAVTDEDEVSAKLAAASVADAAAVAVTAPSSP
jgi:hypothetical protein